MVLTTPAADGGEVTPEGTKKKRLPTNEKGDGRRLVEYLIVVSSIPCNPEASDSENAEFNLATAFDGDEEIEILDSFKPKITARYPSVDHFDNPLHEVRPNLLSVQLPSHDIALTKLTQTFRSLIAK